MSTFIFRQYLFCARYICMQMEGGTSNQGHKLQETKDKSTQDFEFDREMQLWNLKRALNEACLGSGTVWHLLYMSLGPIQALLLRPFIDGYANFQYVQKWVNLKEVAGSDHSLNKTDLFWLPFLIFNFCHTLSVTVSVLDCILPNWNDLFLLHDACSVS